VVITYGISQSSDEKLEDTSTTNPWEIAFWDVELLNEARLTLFTGEIRDMFQKALTEMPITKPYE
jgi:hypothetical protein